MHRFLFPALALLAVVSAPAAELPPNVIMIISDDQAWGDYSFMGHPHIRTPHLDRLAKESLTFRRGYVPSSLCSPSLASIVTGKFPHQHKVTSNDPPFPAGKEKMPMGQLVRDPEFQALRATMNGFMNATPTLPRLLTANGYQTFQSGKWWQGNFKHGGFTHGMTRGEEGGGGGRHGDEGLDIGRKGLQPIYDFIAGARKDAKPFFVWYAPMLPHDPHTPPERLLAKYRDKTPSEHIAKYWAMVEWFDETCGELLDYLDREGLAKNTIVTYVTDNGWIQDPDKPRYAPRSKQSQYDGGLRTPIMVRWPGRIPPRRSDTVISSLDLLPTILAACQIAAPAGLAGVNLLDETAVATRKAIFGECFTHTSRDLQNPAASLRWRWVIADDWKLIVPAPQNEPDAVVELYRLKSDANEEHNLSNQQPGRVEKLRATLDAWWPG